MRAILAHGAGRVAGLVLAPLTATLSTLRQARMFHPRGHLYHADVLPVAEGGDAWAMLADALAGFGLVRLSSAWWKNREWPDVLGCAIRFARAKPYDAQPRPSDQDLLLATTRRPWTLPLAPLLTKFHDFFRNDYFGVSPFRTPSGAIVEWRLRPETPADEGDSRDERLERAVERGQAAFVLEARPYRRLVDVFGRRDFHPIVRVVLREPAAIDQETLRFEAHRAGRGVQPVGFVNGLRVVAYAASQWARPKASTPVAPPERARPGEAAAQPSSAW